MNHRAKPHASTGALPPAPGRAKGAEGSTGACPSQGGRLRPRRGQESWARSRSAAAAPAPPPLLLVSHAPRRRHAPPHIPRAPSSSSPACAAPPACCQPGNGSVYSPRENESILPSLLFLLPTSSLLRVLGEETLKKTDSNVECRAGCELPGLHFEEIFLCSFFPNVSAGKPWHYCFWDFYSRARRVWLLAPPPGTWCGGEI